VLSLLKSRGGSLEGTSSLQLYQHKALIEGTLADPRRRLAARTSLHLEHSVRRLPRGSYEPWQDHRNYGDAGDDAEHGTKRIWKIPYVAIRGYTDAERRAPQATYEPPLEPVIVATSARGFQRGDSVTFDDRDGRGLAGVIVRIDQRAATIGAGTADGGTWRVPVHILRRSPTRRSPRRWSATRPRSASARHSRVGRSAQSRTGCASRSPPTTWALAVASVAARSRFSKEFRENRLTKGATRSIILGCAETDR